MKQFHSVEYNIYAMLFPQYVVDIDVDKALSISLAGKENKPFYY